MMLEVVTAEEVTVTVPGVPVMAAVVPTESLAAVVAWITNLFPAEPRTMFPFVAVMFPVVAVMPVPPVKVVVDAIDPGAIKVAGIERVTTFEAVVAVIWLAVPKTETMLPEEDESSSH